MTSVLFILSLLFVAAAYMLGSVAKGAIHEVGALVLLLCAVVCFVGCFITARLAEIRNELKLQRLGPTK